MAEVSTTGLSRRKMLSGLGVGAVLTGAPLSGLAANSSRTTFLPPATPMKFTRLLRRELGNGKFLSVRRAWHVRFDLIGTDFVLSGDQSSVSVEAPAGLEALARLEEQQIETGLFPLRLDKSGFIQGTNTPVGVPGEASGIEQAIALAKSHIEAAGEKPSSASFMRALQSATSATMSRLPRDVFYPRSLSHDDSRTIDLPDGQTGTIKTEFSASLSADLAYMRSATRSVQTIVGASSRSSLERWDLFSRDTETG